MGYGDEIMATAQARDIYDREGLARKGRQIVIVGRRRRPRWHHLWTGNPIIAHVTGAAPIDLTRYRPVRNAPGARPYVEASAERFVYHEDWRVPRAGELYCVPSPPRVVVNICSSRPFIVLGADLKSGASSNKRWPGEHFSDLTKRLTAAGLAVVQLLPPSAAERDAVPGALLFRSPSFVFACSVLRAAGAYVGHEGGLHHAAAALGRPAVVIYGSMVSPHTTGYDAHRNLYRPHRSDGRACGARVECQPCQAAMRSITAAEVAAETFAALGR